MAEREEISRGIVEAQSVRAIARALSRAASTVRREIGRNGRSRRYRAEASDQRAWIQALRPKVCRLAMHAQLRQAVITKLEENWSPEQIAGWLKRSHPTNEARRVSMKPFIEAFYVQARGVLKQELMAHLRSQRAFRRSRQATAKGDQRGRIADAVSMSERPASASSNRSAASRPTSAFGDDGPVDFRAGVSAHGQRIPGVVGIPSVGFRERRLATGRRSERSFGFAGAAARVRRGEPHRARIRFRAPRRANWPPPSEPPQSQRLPHR